MSLMHPYAVTDRDGVRHVTTLADCLNIQRTPSARQAIMERSFHQLQVGGETLQVEKAFFYLDLARGQAFLVQPPRERFRHADASAALARMLGLLPPSMREQAHQVRVVFGLEELREKLVAAEAGLDDRAVELMKAAVVHEHPVLLTRARLRLSLDRVDAQGAQFQASYDHSPKAFALTYRTPDLFCGDDRMLRHWSGTLQRHDLYRLTERGESWVNYRRWLPSQDAVATLHETAAALARRREPQPASAGFQSMLKRLPRGAWRAAGFGPRLAFEQSGENWYANNKTWYRANGRAFAFNFWYGTLMCVNEATLDFINRRLPDVYAAQSPAEFFAELYALYYDHDDPKRKGIPADVMKWLGANIDSVAATKSPLPKSLRGAKARPGKATPPRRRLAPRR